METWRRTWAASIRPRSKAEASADGFAETELARGGRRRKQRAARRRCRCARGGIEGACSEAQGSVWSGRDPSENRGAGRKGSHPHGRKLLQGRAPDSGTPWEGQMGTLHARGSGQATQSSPYLVQQIPGLRTAAGSPRAGVLPLASDSVGLPGRIKVSSAGAGKAEEFKKQESWPAGPPPSDSGAHPLSPTPLRRGFGPPDSLRPGTPGIWPPSPPHRKSVCPIPFLPRARKFQTSGPWNPLPGPPSSALGVSCPASLTPRPTPHLGRV